MLVQTLDLLAANISVEAQTLGGAAGGFVWRGFSCLHLLGLILLTL